jgi:hypothetical protein
MHTLIIKGYLRVWYLSAWSSRLILSMCLVLRPSDSLRPFTAESDYDLDVCSLIVGFPRLANSWPNMTLAPSRPPRTHIIHGQNKQDTLMSSTGTRGACFNALIPLPYSVEWCRIRTSWTSGHVDYLVLRPLCGATERTLGLEGNYCAIIEINVLRLLAYAAFN